VVEFFVDKVHGAARGFCAIIEGLLLRIEAGERRQQRRMNIQNPVAKSPHEFRRQQPHVASQANQLNVVLAKTGNHLRIVFRALAALGYKHRGR